MGEKRVDVWLSPVLFGHVRAGADAGGVSLGEWVAEAVRERVERQQSVVDGQSVVRESRPSLDELLERGRAARVAGRVALVSRESDPLEEIA